MFTVSQVSEMLNIKVSTLYAWVAQGKIPHLKIHGLIRFQPETLHRWIESFKHLKSQPPQLTETRSPSLSCLDNLIARAKREAYNPQTGKSGQNRALKEKEETNGAL